MRCPLAVNVKRVAVLIPLNTVGVKFRVSVPQNVGLFGERDCHYLDDDGYLYFIVHSIDAVFRIDENFEVCEKYTEASEFGDVSYSSLGVWNIKTVSQK